MDRAELQARIDELSDEQAVAALAYVLDVEEVSAARRADLERDTRELPALLAEVNAARDLPTPAGPAHVVAARPTAALGAGSSTSR